MNEGHLENVSSIKKVNIFLRAIGEAPILKKQKFKLDGSKTILEVEKFLKKSLNISDKTIYICTVARDLVRHLINSCKVFMKVFKYQASWLFCTE